MEIRRFRDTNYYVYSDGRVWSSYSKGSFKTIMDNGRGYKVVKLCFGEKGNKVKKRLYLHRVVAECFIENPMGYEQVNHKNGIKGDNRVENLEWCSRRSNMNHAFVMGLIPINVDNWLPKKEKVVRVLSNEQAQECRDLWFKGVGYMELGVMYGFKSSVIRDACNGLGGYVIKGFTPDEWIERERFLKEMERDLELDLRKQWRQQTKMRWVVEFKIDWVSFLRDNHSQEDVVLIAGNK